MTRVLVTGASGLLGRELVPRLAAAGYAVRAMSRRPEAAAEVEWVRADLADGRGLEAAVAGTDVIVHAATSPYRRSRRIDVDGTRRLLEAARAAAVRHVVHVSIVGVDHIPFPYYRRKLATERMIAGSGVPWSILRATQFFPLVDRALSALNRLPILLLPTDLLGQPVDPGEVAARLVTAVAAPPGGYLPEVGGPEVLSLGDAAAAWLAARGERRRLVHVPLPGAVAGAFRRGDNTTRATPTGRVTWGAWLARRYPTPRPVRRDARRS